MVSSTKRRAHPLLTSFRFAFRGVWCAWREERNFRIQVFYGLVVFSLVALLQPPAAQSLLCLLTAVLVVAVELLNSALERAVDLACGEHHRLAAEAKDMAAAAVMLVSLSSALVVLWTMAGELSLEALIGVGGLLLVILGGRRRVLC